VKTDDLIKMLSTNVAPTRSRELGSALLIGIGIGAAIALCFECSMFGTSVDGFSAAHPGLQAGVIALALSLVVAGSRLLFVSARPGRRGSGSLLLIGILFLAVFLAGVLGFVREPRASWNVMLSGQPLADCLTCIPVIAIPTLVALFWALRKGAPVYPALAGAAAGIVAGALAMAALAMHQPAVSLLGTAVLYGGPVVLCALIGAVLGWRLLRG
jgi:hypothetical protein